MKIIIKIFVFLFVLCVSVPKSYAQVSVGLSITVAPPVLPVYVQPACPTDGFLWCPGYWAWGPDGYYWVPGVWVVAPTVGYLWTPGYWGFAGGYYGWHGGYWGPHIGFYGGVNYGYGYGGVGFVGGMWDGGHFRYNTAVVNVNTTVIHNTYINRTVINNTTVNHTSFNGPGGITARPSAQEQVAMREQHIQPTSIQTAHERTASQDRNQLASVNHGRPAIASMNSVGGSRFSTQGRSGAGVHSSAPAARTMNTPSNRPANPRPSNPANTQTQRPVYSQQPHTQQPRTQQARPQQAHPQQAHQQQPHPQPARPQGGERPERH
jgi:WXXGXW repeat (2 copies)